MARRTGIRWRKGSAPVLGEAAWRVAEQLLAVGGSPQTRPWELGLAVSRSDAWFLHDRP
ncbi:hypothetical protein [Dactylosporangium sp. NPDC005555]|uniref:hypothetical protein n=1 Tax=Dactylosporangium sp. NPDC005555 TaxID=3154889 RepID=UPI00339E4D6B